MENNHLVIMAGGIGSRFWPLSTPDRPKQFADVLGTGKTLIQLTVDRFKGLVNLENVWIVTSERYKFLISEQLPFVNQDNILFEPCMRNTAPCIAYVAWKIKSRYPDANVIVAPSDHIVLDTIEFQNKISEGLLFTANNLKILTLGVLPSKPDIGYGYIQVNQQCEMIKSVLHFKEKPTLDVAQLYLDSGDYYWNSGIFIWSVKAIESVFRLYQPEISAIFDELDNFYYTENEQIIVNKIYSSSPFISIDYAIMEKAVNVYVLPVDFGWNDLGTWGALYELNNHDDFQNAVIGNDIKLIETTNCMVFMPSGKKVVIQGLEGFIVSEYRDTLLICKLEDEHRIKEFSS